MNINCDFNSDISKYLNDVNGIYKSCVYKSCFNHIVVLEKLENTQTNECRTNIVNIPFAKYRGDKFIVRDIIHKFDNNNKVQLIKNSNYDSTITYELGKEIQSDKFDNDLNNICSNGIHYFLNIKCAFYYSLNKIENGEHLLWYDNGRQLIQCTYVEGNLDGEYLQWHNNGQQWKKYTYIKGKLEGLCLNWYKNGQQWKKCTYIDGEIEGEYLEWHENGQQYMQCTYVNGKLDGEYLRWYDNGRQFIQCTYVNEKIDGELYVNGRQFKKYNYVNGRLNIWNDMTMNND